jgi:hypothetical protein
MKNLMNEAGVSSRQKAALSEAIDKATAQKSRIEKAREAAQKKRKMKQASQNEESIDLSELARRLKFGGRLTKSESLAVLKRIQNLPNDSDIHNLVRVFALSRPPTPENVAVVSPLLSEDYDDYSLWGVVLALCSYWSLTHQFVDKLLDILERPTWPDKLNQTGHAALTEIGLEANRVKSKAILKKLVSLYDDTSHSNDSLDEWERNSRIVAIYRAIDIALNGPDAILNYIDFKVADDIDEEMIQRARQQAGE